MPHPTSRPNPKTIEVRAEAVISSDIDDFHLKGVHFEVRQGAGLWVLVATTTIEGLEVRMKSSFAVCSKCVCGSGQGLPGWARLHALVLAVLQVCLMLVVLICLM